MGLNVSFVYWSDFIDYIMRLFCAPSQRAYKIVRRKFSLNIINKVIFSSLPKGMFCKVKLKIAPTAVKQLTYIYISAFLHF